MAMEEALKARLLAASGIVALAGTTVDWFDRPRGDATYAITLTMVSAGRDYTMDGPDGLDQPRVQFDCWGSTKERTGALKRAVIAEMEQARTIGGWVFEAGFLELELWGDPPEDLPGGGKMFRIELDFIFFHHQEA